MTINFTPTFGDGEYEVSLWDRVPGKERLYIKYAGADKDLGYYDLSSKTLTVTRATWNARGQRERFEAIANAYALTVTIAEPAQVTPARSEPARSVPSAQGKRVSGFDNTTERKAFFEAAYDMGVRRGDVEDETIWRRVQHNL